jgi:hypothetical protein
MAAGGSQGVHCATGRAVAIDHRASEGVLQGLPEEQGVWELVHQSAVYLSEAAWVCV